MSEKLHTEKHLLHFSHCDPAGIIFYSRVYELHHETYEKWVDQAESWAHWFKNDRYAFPIVHSEADYSAPMSAGEVVEVVLKKTKVSESSFRLESSIYCGDKLSASVSSIHVCVHKSNFQKAPLPDFVKKALGELG